MNTLALLITSFVLLLGTADVVCRASQRNLGHIPLKADERTSVFSHNVGCVFGNKKYDLDSQWHPILEPYGVMYCLRCSCSPVIKKGLLQSRGQVKCKSVTDECPDVSDCRTTPTLPPNSCCKICPDKTDASSKASLLPYSSRALLDNNRLEHQAASSIGYMRPGAAGASSEFSVLLARHRGTSTNIAGYADVSLDSTHVRMTIVLSSYVEVDRIQLVKKGGQIIFSESVKNDERRGQFAKFCLSSTGALNYSDDLRAASVHMIVTTKTYPNGILKGLVKQVSAKVLESFNSIMIDSLGRGYAAYLAMGLELSSNNLLIRGEFSNTGSSGITSGKEQITLEIANGRRVLFSRTIDLSFTLGKAEMRTEWVRLSTSNLKQLGRGRLTAFIKLNTGTSLSGQVTTFQRCGKLQALVSGADAVPEHSTAGVAVGSFKLKRNGHIEYKIEIRDIDSKITEAVIETDRSPAVGAASKITRLAKDVGDRSIITLDGTYTKPNAREIQLLLQGQLFVNIKTKLKSDSSLRGQILIVPTDVKDPILMRHKDSGLAAQAWCSTDDCLMTCSILVPRTSVRRDGTTRAFLDFWEKKKLLGTFTETNIIDAMLSRNEVQAISSTLPTLRLSTDDVNLYGQISLPRICVNSSHGDDLPVGDEGKTRRSQWIDPNLKQDNKCSYDGKVYDDGESWKPEASSLQCVTCSCKRNKAQCHPVLCPQLDCNNPVNITGECCPACPKPTDDTSKTCFFAGDHRHHAVGTLWHPFMHPGGYFKCVVCFCQEDGNGYSCKSATCPKLNCSKQFQTTIDGECCPVCQEPQKMVNVQVDVGATMQGDDNKYTMCRVGKNTYANGETFNPEIGIFGKYESLICTCDNGSVSCKRVKCNCKSRKARRDRCCMKQCGFKEEDMIGRKRRRKHRNRFC